MIRRFVLAGATIAFLAAAVLADGPSDAVGAAFTCKPGEVRGLVSGRHICLRDGAACRERFDSDYHRYGFHCHSGELVRDDVLLLHKRPLVTPRLTAGSDCPLTPSAGPIGRFQRGLNGTTYGVGPAYPAFYGPSGDRPLLQVGRGTFDPPGWLFGKVIWVVDHRDRAYRGNALLIRGRRVDGPGELRFRLATRLVLRADFVRGSEVSVREPGCYALQIDGRGFSSRVIVFQAVAAP